ALDSHLDAVTVELDLVYPPRPGWRPVDQAAQLRGDEGRHGAAPRGTRLFGFCGAGLRGLARRGSAARRGARPTGWAAIAGRGIPHRVRFSGELRVEHEGAWSASLAGGNLIQRAAGGDRAVIGEECIAVVLVRVCVAMLDQEPVASSAAFAILA